jgi:hypothetical protein
MRTENLSALSPYLEPSTIVCSIENKECFRRLSIFGLEYFKENVIT